MSRQAFPLNIGDLSAFARSLNAQLAACGRTPGHLELLNMLARSGGYRNYQHLRAQNLPQATEPAPEPLNQTRLTRLARLFDAEGRLLRWPGKRGMEESCLWVVWSRLPARQTLSETQLNGLLQALHSFGDHALLRRGLCDCGLMARTPDGRQYQRIERKPTAEALALLERLGKE